jgi:PAS domain S-box-containing protein
MKIDLSCRSLVAGILGVLVFGFACSLLAPRIAETLLLERDSRIAADYIRGVAKSSLPEESSLAANAQNMSSFILENLTNRDYLSAAVYSSDGKLLYSNARVPKGFGGIALEKATLGRVAYEISKFNGGMAASDQIMAMNLFVPIYGRSGVSAILNVRKSLEKEYFAITKIRFYIWGLSLLGLFIVSLSSFAALRRRSVNLLSELAKAENEEAMIEFESKKKDLIHAELIKTNRALETTFDTLVDGLVVLDSAWVIRDVNRSGELIIGYKKGELMGKFAADLCTEEGKLKLIEGMEKLSSKGKIKDLELSLVTKKGEVVSAKVNASAVKDHKGEISGFVAMMSDVTRVKELSVMKSKFLSNISHELRTPLTSIKGFVSTILSDKNMIEATRNEFLEIVADETDKLTSMVSNLIDLTTLELGALQISKAQTNIGKIVGEVIEEFRSSVEKKHVKLETHFSPDGPMVLADSAKLKRVMANLMSNAIKFTPEGGSVGVSAERVGEGVKISVVDTGVGISEDDLKKIFDKDYRMEKFGEKGFGIALGLPLVKSIVESHGGFVSAQSALGGGSEFSFVIPKGEWKGEVQHGGV